MTIKIFNHTKLTQRVFFQDLIEFLSDSDDVTLRKIKHQFPLVENLERQIEEFVQAGLILRQDKRYTNGFQVFGDSDISVTLSVAEPKILVFDGPLFIDAASMLRQRLETSQVQQVLANDTNQIKLHLASDFAKTDDNLANYFYHVEKRMALSSLEQKVYHLIGDVDPNYALKYMTTFLLKFVKKETVKNKNPDIFVKALALFGYIVEVSEYNYHTTLEFSDVQLEKLVIDDAKDYITQQVCQVTKLKPFITI